MINFNYSIPTEIFFGKGSISILGKQLKRYGAKVLVVYGGGSIKKNGIYDLAIKLIKESKIKFWELSGVEPNPKISSVRQGVKICRDNRIDCILAIGGGSVIDCSKAIAAGYYYGGDPWDIVTDPSKIKKALPVASILTLAATGSEMDIFAVITNEETKEKLGTKSSYMAPRFSILDPTYTFTVSKNQTAAGTADIMSHIMENYFNNTEGAYVQDRLAEALLKTCIKYGPIALEKPDDYDARANLMWTSSLAINGLLDYGKVKGWSVHGMEHELSAFYDITHGVGLAILTPYWMEYVLDNNTLDKFVEYGINIWSIDKNKDKFTIAHESIEKTREFFNSLGLPARLKEVGIDEENFEKMAEGATRHGKLGEFKPLSKQDVINIYKSAL
ncbi:iron-containing alcohol dehydrogenase [Clostridium tyrobutyricum]|uniref:iron-containing alcohol dehydrogenase n=1 Tax=Clostridium tyrobutyricum TaxID=1519 RepID=UPI001C388B54|nr:iron-containing alcohol dehydrogenase [Clostridium tyrobutyricum]MBV4425356.1 iron-containing alcohol dehydrogenase [Clostridium tyrobutyricum]